MSYKCTKEINTQVLISLLKQHGISKIVSSPGATNVAFIGSVQDDPFFQVYSSVDERSAAYIACGLSEESGEPVVISCTGATASRNYLPGLTEAYYRKLPILAVTSTQPVMRVGHHIAQVIDRSVIQNDVAKLSVDLPIVHNKDDIWDCEIKVNKAILELTRNGGGPVHINLPTTFTLPFENIDLPKYRVINRISYGDKMPPITGKVAIFIGAHKKFSVDETALLDKFCEVNNALVICDHTSSYKGKYRVLASLLTSQELMDKSSLQPDLIVHIGEVSGDYYSLSIGAKEVWRVSEDGEVRDTFRKLRYIFAINEMNFFGSYSDKSIVNTKYYEDFSAKLYDLRKAIPELPLSNIWIASKLAEKIPKNSYVHLGILNTLRSWNFFDVSKQVHSSSNVGGFGIDGALSTTLGASLASTDRLCFCILGDLAFFYDMNALGNRHVPNNLRILVINNGKGTEFRQYSHHASYFGDKADLHIAAAEHYGNKSTALIKNYSENLGFKYLSANTKEGFNSVFNKFLEFENNEKPMLFEVFTDSEDESKALEQIRNIAEDKSIKLRRQAKKIIGTSSFNVIKKALKK